MTTQVDAAAGPWSPSVNQKLMPFGAVDARPAVTVPFDLAGGKIEIYASGTTRIPGKEAVGPMGVEDDPVDDREVKTKRYPSFYTPKVLYPANRLALIGVLADGTGKVVGRPFVVGEGVRVPISENAAAVSLGFNDVAFSGNSGSLTVIVDIPE